MGQTVEFLHAELIVTGMMSHHLPMLLQALKMAKAKNYSYTNSSVGCIVQIDLVTSQVQVAKPEPNDIDIQKERSS